MLLFVSIFSLVFSDLEVAKFALHTSFLFNIALWKSVNFQLMFFVIRRGRNSLTSTKDVLESLIKLLMDSFIASSSLKNSHSEMVKTMMLVL